MSKVSIDMFVCDSCGFKDVNKYKFRRFIGNVMVGCEGGLIGNNIWTPDNPRPVDYDDQPPAFWAEDLQIYASDLCLECTSRILGIDRDENGNVIDTLGK
jgi:hypothetical protein